MYLRYALSREKQRTTTINNNYTHQQAGVLFLLAFLAILRFSIAARVPTTIRDRARGPCASCVRACVYRQRAPTYVT